MTNDEQTEHWYKFHRFQTRYESIYTPKFNHAIQEQYKQFTETGTVMNVDSMPMYNVLNDLYLNASYIWAHRATTNLRKERLTMGFSERIVELMKQYYGIDLLNLADDITQTTKDIIARVLSQAAQDGFGFDEVVKRLQSPELSRKRARTIARTETVASANAASNVAARDSGLLMDKIWISARDNRVRRQPRDQFDHMHANGQTVGMDDKFTVSGESLAFPGDKKEASEGNVINCRCTHAFIPKRDSNGRLIRL